MTSTRSHTSPSTLTPNFKARELVQRTQPFKGSNTFAENIGGAYVVFSYGYHFPMFAFKDGIWYRNNERYSRTTSKHQRQLQPLASEKMTSLPTDALRALLVLK